MSNIRWSVVVPEETDRALRSYLAKKGARKAMSPASWIRQCKRGCLNSPYKTLRSATVAIILDVIDEAVSAS